MARRKHDKRGSGWFTVVPPAVAAISAIVMLPSSFAAARSLGHGVPLAVTEAVGMSALTTFLLVLWLGTEVSSRSDFKLYVWKRLLAVGVGAAAVAAALHFLGDYSWLVSVVPAPAAAAIGLFLLALSLGL